MRIVFILLFLSGCGTAPTGYWENDGTGALVWNQYDQPACSDVTISLRQGVNRSYSCAIR